MRRSGCADPLAAKIPETLTSEPSKDEGPMSISTEGRRKEDRLAEGSRVVLQALLIALGIQTLLFQPFSIPSGSMKATLLIGDYLFVSKYSYGYSHYSLPLSPPLFSGRIFGAAPQRGDVAVFRLPKDDSTDYVKRVVGLPGDRIQMIDGLLHIKGPPVKPAGTSGGGRGRCVGAGCSRSSGEQSSRAGFNPPLGRADRRCANQPYVLGAD